MITEKDNDFSPRELERRKRRLQNCDEYKNSQNFLSMIQEQINSLKSIEDSFCHDENKENISENVSHGQNQKFVSPQGAAKLKTKQGKLSLTSQDRLGALNPSFSERLSQGGAFFVEILTPEIRKERNSSCTNNKVLETKECIQSEYYNCTSEYMAPETSGRLCMEVVGETNTSLTLQSQESRTGSVSEAIISAETTDESNYKISSGALHFPSKLDDCGAVEDTALVLEKKQYSKEPIRKRNSFTLVKSIFRTHKKNRKSILRNPFK
eukprot:snap_masked-scaffold_5-processed-gene-16.31-mRNA-1 protein AED:1.00 eAED:1.00 QI:0/-1/0/0/-1/1/1/0/266